MMQQLTQLGEAAQLQYYKAVVYLAADDDPTGKIRDMTAGDGLKIAMGIGAIFMIFHGLKKDNKRAWALFGIIFAAVFLVSGGAESIGTLFQKILNGWNS